ncbi:unnamed protein product [Bursaphelenchus okinawaensis]|uniref:Uncharacterized protein n=1 Tax=Bursaphelenchus okinawaensis TaxID=465554 RepID=A0A811L3Y0_9BILA|nr:unnamed protein product [Bursaphelenchus okinawaensis]CAG9116853.1 unnamed protein product [Bursaphelenchus okinawaensis]
MVHIFDKHISITPYHPDLVLNGIRGVKDFSETSLKRLQWPHEKGQRKPAGGDGGEIVAESITVLWQDGQLIFPLSEVPQALATREKDHSIVKYHGLFLAQLDGEVAYQPSEQNGDFYYILVENVDHKWNVIRFAADQTAVLEPFVKHSMPIPSRNGLEYLSYHRAVNAVEKFIVDSDEAPVFNIMKVDRQSLVATGRVSHKYASAGHEHHSVTKSFSKQLLSLEDAADDVFEPFGQIITDIGYVEEPTEVLWPGVLNKEGFAGVLEQDFQMSWVPNGEGAYELVFKGLSGSFAGDEGKPGVEYNPELGIYKANLMLTRPDSSFFLKAASPEAAFAMLFALPKDGKGEPDDHTLRGFIFAGGKALRLPPHVWHSVPIPLASQESILLTEVIAATNANLTIDVENETGHSIQFTQSI